MTIHSSLGATLAALISNTCVEAIAMIAATDSLSTTLPWAKHNARLLL